MRKLANIFLIIFLCIGLIPCTAFAVTGDQLAADGTYTGSSKEGTVTVTVSDGKITGVTANVKDKYKDRISSWANELIGKGATYNNVDAVTAATKHIGYIKNGALAAISGAPSADGSSSGEEQGGENDPTEPDGTQSNPYIVKVGETLQIRSKHADESGYSGWAWTPDADNISVDSGASTAVVTVKALSETSAPVRISCRSSLMGIFPDTEVFFVSVIPADDSGSSEEEPATDDEIGKGIGERTGTKHTGTASGYKNSEGDWTDEWVKLDVYEDKGKITGVFIAEQNGHWLNLLNTIKDKFIGEDADSDKVDTITSATTKGFRDTLRDAVSNALKDSANTPDNSVEHEKSIEKAADNEYEIKLSVTGKDVIAASGGEEKSVRPVDVVLLLDCSGTMQKENRFSNMKEQANSFINKLAADNGDSQVAVVAYGQYSYNSGHNDITTLNNGWTTLKTGAGNLTDALNSQGYLTGDNYSYGTDHGGAYVRAQELLDDDAVANDGRTKYIVNISDGVFDYNEFPYYSTEAAEALKNNGVKIYYITIGSEADSTKVNSLASSPSSDYVYSGGSSGEELAGIFSTIENAIEEENALEPATEVVHMTNVKIKDTLSANVELNGEITAASNDGSSFAFTPSDAGGTFDELKDGVKYTVTIPVKVSDLAKEDFKAKGNDENNYPDTSDKGERGYYSNDNNTESDKSKVTLSYLQGDTEKTVPYVEKPVVQIVSDTDSTEKPQNNPPETKKGNASPDNKSTIQDTKNKSGKSDKPVTEKQKEASGENANKSRSVATGDDRNPAIYIGFIAIAAILTILIIRRRKKK